MTVSAKCYYGLRAIYALAEHGTETPMKANDIAERQHIPIKFLESILSQLRGGGFVNSRRGAEGGFTDLIKDNKELSVTYIADWTI